MTGTTTPCANGHVWLWSGGGKGDLLPPDGLPCQCGAMIAHRCRCPACGELRNVPEYARYPDGYEDTMRALAGTAPGGDA